MANCRYLRKGLLRQFDSVGAVADAFGLPLDNVTATLREYVTVGAQVVANADALPAAVDPAAPSADEFGKK